MKLTYLNDPAHGWVSVPHKLLFDLGIVDKISRYSYMTETRAYLEEDCDAVILIEALKLKGIICVMVEKYSDRMSPVRSYARYSPELMRRSA